MAKKQVHTSRKEKIAVALMFILVVTVFSIANRDTQKLIERHSRATASRSSVSMPVTASTDTPRIR